MLGKLNTKIRINTTTNADARKSGKSWFFITEIHQLWQSGFSRVYSNCCCSCWFEPEIITIGQSSHKMYSNSILNFQEFTPILNAHAKKVRKLILCTSYYGILYNIITIGKNIIIIWWNVAYVLYILLFSVIVRT